MRLVMTAALWIVFVSQTAFGGGITVPHVTGIGGVFFKSKGDNKALAAWYEKHLGVKLESWGGAVFRSSEDPTGDKGATAWHIAEKDTKWFDPSKSSFMINYRVDDLDGMIANLKKEGIKIVQGPETSEQGKFAWIVDPDDNKIELWEPKN
jgi:predicted enzyme related to lactoylglutathione lyase